MHQQYCQRRAPPDEFRPLAYLAELLAPWLPCQDQVERLECWAPWLRCPDRAEPPVRWVARLAHWAEPLHWERVRPMARSLHRRHPRHLHEHHRRRRHHLRRHERGDRTLVRTEQSPPQAK